MSAVGGACCGAAPRAEEAEPPASAHAAGGAATAARAGDSEAKAPLHSDYDQGGQKGPFWDLSQNIFSSIHSISPKFRERSGNGQTWLNPKFE